MKLARLIVAKTVANTALRWIPPFLPELEAAFGATTKQMTTVLGLGEFAGLSTIGIGRTLDRGRERLVMTCGLVAISISSMVALVGTTFMFAIGFVLVVVGVANCTVAGHVAISHRVDYERRARSIGLFETSWALALLIGAPVIAGLIHLFGWRGPFVVLAIAAGLSASMLWRMPDAERAPLNTLDAPSPQVESPRPGLTTRAWTVIVGSAALAMGGLGIFTVSGIWLDEAFGVETAGLGAIAMGYGAIELLASMSSAGIADRLGKFRGTMCGIVVMGSGLVVMAIAGDRLWMGIAGILMVLGGFEFAFVTSLSLVSEAMPEARGTTIALSNGVGTVARGTGTIASGLLFDWYGIAGSLTLSGGALTTAAVAFTLNRRARA